VRLRRTARAADGTGRVPGCGSFGTALIATAAEAEALRQHEGRGPERLDRVEAEAARLRTQLERLGVGRRAVEPPDGIEPSTYSLRVNRSAD